MFQWLSQYNYDFALAAIPIQILLLIFYCSRRNLPIRASYSFLWVMLANLAMTAFDLVSCEMNEIWTEYPLWLLYAVNQAYFLGFIIRGWALYDYTAEECQGYTSLGKPLATLAGVPVIFAIFMILSTPWTATVFHFAQDKGYYNCYMYPIIYFCTYFYIAMSLLCVFLRRKQMEFRLQMSMLGYNAVLLAGIILRKEFINTLVTSYFSILAILVIYLSAQNPDLYRDRQTHLFNKDAFDKIAQEFRRKRTQFHCIIVTADNYASAKVLYGYQQIERTIGLIGRWMIDAFREYYVFYYGHGEFLLLQKGKFEDNREHIIRELNTRFSHPWKGKDTEVSLSMSAMVLPYQILPEEMEQIDDLVEFSFSQTYVENKKGNMIFSREIVTDLYRRKAVETALARALENRRIEVYMQPIYSVKERRIVGAEALARLRDPEMGFIAPEEFVRIAERTGDIMELGRQVFDQVCGFLATGKAQRLGIRKVNVNLSPAQCRNDQLSTELIAIAERYGVPLNLIDFEITETSIEDHLLIRKQMLRLQEKGATFSLDDFGTGTSNLIRLLNLPIHVVKLDMYIVRSYFTGRTGILPDLVRMFHNANVRVVAEGIETAEMKETLAGIGCDYEQGYYYSRPVPLDEFIELLQENIT